jgi:hypothetical protein
MMRDAPRTEDKLALTVGTGVALGAGLGLVFGAAFGNVGLGLVFGAGIGTALVAAFRRSKSDG